MPRTWFSWTDSVLLGSNRLFIVSEMTVPGLRHAKQLVAAIRERLGDGPQPQVIVNRFEQRMFAPGLQQQRHRAGARRRLRRRHPQRLPAGARGDRPRRAARRGQARQQDHRAAQEADRCRRPRQGRRRKQRRPDRRSSSSPGRDERERRNRATVNANGRPFHRSTRCRAGAAPAVEEPRRRRSTACPGRCSRSRSREPAPARQPANPLLSDKLLDAKVRLHRRLIEEINLSALEKLPEDEMRQHIQQLVTQYIAGRAAGAQHAGTRTSSSPKSSTR